MNFKKRSPINPILSESLELLIVNLTIYPLEQIFKQVSNFSFMQILSIIILR